MNSREKGKRGERAWRDELRAQGFEARRGQQFSGSADSPDVVCPALPWIHFEVKCVERLNIEDAMAQAKRDGRTKIPVVAHKRNFCGWLVTMDAETFFKFLRGDFSQPQKGAEESTSPQPSPQSGEGGKIWDAVERVPIAENKNNNGGHRPLATTKEQNENQK